MLAAMSTPDDRPLDRDLFDRILARAIELDAERGDTPLHEADLIEAGRELGIDEAVTRAAVVEVLTHNADAVFEKPFDSPITLDVTKEGLRLSVPPHERARVRGVVVFHLVLVAFNLALTGVWLRMGGWALLSALFGSLMCLVIGASLRDRVREVLEHVELRLDETSGEIVYRSGALLRRQRLELRHLRSRVVPTQPGNLAHIELEYGTRIFQIMPGRSMAELRWVGASLSAWLRKHRRS